MALGAYMVGMFTVPVEIRPSIYFLEPMHPAIAGIEMSFVQAPLPAGFLLPL